MIVGYQKDKMQKFKTKLARINKRKSITKRPTKRKQLRPEVLAVQAAGYDKADALNMRGIDVLKGKSVKAWDKVVAGLKGE